MTDPARPSRRIAVLGWSLIVLLPVLVLGGVEAVVRLLDIQPAFAGEAAVPAWLDRNILIKETRWIEMLSESPADLGNYYRTYRWDRRLFYRLQPDLDLPMTDITAPAPVRERTRWTFHTNERGYNARVVPWEKPPGVFRIVTMGDSSTFGWGVDTDRIYPHVLEKLLRERHPSMRIEVVNLGVCGYSSLQGLVLLRSEGMLYHPDVVLISYGSNDYSLVPETFEQAYERNLGWSGAVREALHHSRAYLIYAARLQRAAAQRSKGGAGGVLNVGPDRSRDNLIEMAAHARRGGAEPIFVTNCVPGDMAWPNHAASEETGAPLLDTRALLEAAIPMVMTAEQFERERSRYLALYGRPALERFGWLSVYLTDECHPNVIGHALIAEALVPMVESTEAFRTASASRR